MLMLPMRDGTTSEDSATQLLICEPLSFAINITISESDTQIFSWRRISSVQVHIDLQADSLPEGAHL